TAGRNGMPALAGIEPKATRYPLAGERGSARWPRPEDMRHPGPARWPPRLDTVVVSLIFVCAAVLAHAAGRADARLFVVRQPTAAEAARRNTHARFEPAVGCYLGAYIDFDATLTDRVTDQTGTAHASPAAFESV